MCEGEGPEGGGLAGAKSQIHLRLSQRLCWQDKGSFFSVLAQRQTCQGQSGAGARASEEIRFQFLVPGNLAFLPEETGVISPKAAVCYL